MLDPKGKEVKRSHKRAVPRLRGEGTRSSLRLKKMELEGENIPISEYTNPALCEGSCAQIASGSVFLLRKARRHIVARNYMVLLVKRSSNVEEQGLMNESGTPLKASLAVKTM